MASLNVITLIGRLTADPELRYTGSGTEVANFTLAVDRRFSKNDETDFIPIVTWQQLAVICNEFLHKGKLVAITGRLETSSYEDKDGNKRKSFHITAEQMQMLSSKSDGGESAPSGGVAKKASGSRPGASSSARPGAAASGSRPGGSRPQKPKEPKKEETPEDWAGDPNLGIDDIPF